MFHFPFHSPFADCEAFRYCFETEPLCRSQEKNLPATRFELQQYLCDRLQGRIEINDRFRPVYNPQLLAGFANFIETLFAALSMSVICEVGGYLEHIAARSPFVLLEIFETEQSGTGFLNDVFRIRLRPKQSRYMAKQRDAVALEQMLYKGAMSISTAHLRDSTAEQPFSVSFRSARPESAAQACLCSRAGPC